MWILDMPCIGRLSPGIWLSKKQFKSELNFKFYLFYNVSFHEDLRLVRCFFKRNVYVLAGFSTIHVHSRR